MAVVERHIAASPEAVFAVLGNGWLYSGWVVGTSHMRAVEEEWPAAGSRLFHSTGTWPATVADETRVEHVAEGERLVLLAKGGAFGQARIDLTLTGDGGGSTVVRMEEVPVQGAGRWLHNALLDRAIAWRNRQALARLAMLSERPTSPQRLD